MTALILLLTITIVRRNCEAYRNEECDQHFFDRVMVMAEDEAIKSNRLALLHVLPAASAG